MRTLPSSRRRPAAHQVRRIPAERLPQIELIPYLMRRNPMHALLEIDVSRARRRIRDVRERTGARVSFTGFLIGCLARAVHEDLQVQAFRKGRNVIIFDQVDVATLVEVDAGSKKVPVPYVVRDAPSKSLGQIQAELVRAKGGGEMLRAMQRRVAKIGWLPRPLRSVLWWALARSPQVRKRFGGTVVLTSIGMYGAGPGWGLGEVSYPLTVTVGGIARRAVVQDGAVKEQEALCITVSFDHEVIDGAPAARFLARLRTLIETAHGLEDEQDVFGDETVQA